MNAPTAHVPGAPVLPEAEAAFWREARRRRNHFFFVWAGWLPVGAALVALYSLLFPSGLVGSLALLTWGPFWFWVALRVRKLSCVRCGNRAFDHAFFFMRHAACQSCGFSFRR